MLKYRLIFGTLMIVVLSGLVWLDDVIAFNFFGPNLVQGTILTAVLLLLAIPAQIEFKNLALRSESHVFLPITIISSMLLAGSWYFRQFVSNGAGGVCKFHSLYVLFVLAFSVCGIFFYQARKFGTAGTIKNCSASMFSVLYLGLLSSFVLAIRVEYGIWVLLMFVMTVKSSDIGAYTLGRLFGKHKFSPTISPGKTWEGMAGAMIFAGLVGFAFTKSISSLSWYEGVLFGVIFAFVGQLGDLAESMLKRDAGSKDSASNVPGFGGVLDVIDSPLLSAPLAYLFFMITIGH